MKHPNVTRGEERRGKVPQEPPVHGLGRQFALLSAAGSATHG